MYQRMLQDIRSYFREMNVSEQLADAMLRIEPAKVRLLDDTALASYGLTETDPIEQETLDLKDAQYYGVSRQEYMRRQSLAERICPSVWGGPDIGSECYETVMKTGQTPPKSVPQGVAAFDRQWCIRAGKSRAELENCVRERVEFRSRIPVGDPSRDGRRTPRVATPWQARFPAIVGDGRDAAIRSPPGAGRFGI